jgi:hypothetical protein
MPSGCIRALSVEVAAPGTEITHVPVTDGCMDLERQHGTAAGRVLSLQSIRRFVVAAEELAEDNLARMRPLGQEVSGARACPARWHGKQVVGDQLEQVRKWQICIQGKHRRPGT